MKNTAAMPATDVTVPVAIERLTPEMMKEVLQGAGYRVEQREGPNGIPVLRSATSGMAFEIHLANPPPGGKGGFVDATFHVLLLVKGELPLSLVNRWNGTRRFARLHLQPEMLLLEMDVSVLGGVSESYLRVKLEIWDRLVQQLAQYLRDELPKLAVEDQAKADSVPTETGKEESVETVA